MNAPSLYADHRARFQETLAGLDAAAVIPTGALLRRNGDAEHRFRPSSDFWYLTGFEEPDAVLVLLPPGESRSTSESVLFLNPRDPARETWTGRRLGVDAAPDALGVDRAQPIDELWSALPELLEGAASVCWDSGLDADADRALNRVLAALRGRARSTAIRPTAVLDLGPLLHEQRLVKSPAELERMRRAVAVSARAHAEVMAAARPGLFEYELDGLLDAGGHLAGGVVDVLARIVAGGANACVLHYVRNDRVLADGDLVLVDAGCEWEYYASDVTRTFPVNGRFSDAQRALYEVVLGANERGLEACVEGSTVEAVHQRARETLCAGLRELGLIEGGVEEALENGELARFYPHGTSHWLGLDVHDCGAYAQHGASRPLEPGMVLTVEPGLYVAPDDDRVDERWRGIGIRLEDDVLIVPGGHEVLTAAIPKAVDAVEAACAAAG